MYFLRYYQWGVPLICLSFWPHPQSPLLGQNTTHIHNWKEGKKVLFKTFIFKIKNFKLRASSDAFYSGALLGQVVGAADSNITSTIRSQGSPNQQLQPPIVGRAGRTRQWDSPLVSIRRKYTFTPFKWSFLLTQWGVPLICLQYQQNKGGGLNCWKGSTSNPNREAQPTAPLETMSYPSIQYICP